MTMKFNINVKIKGGPTAVINAYKFEFNEGLLVVDYLCSNGMKTRKLYPDNKIESFSVSFIEDK